MYTSSGIGKGLLNKQGIGMNKQGIGMNKQGIGMSIALSDAQESVSISKNC